jgi:hypothetical protein
LRFHGGQAFGQASIRTWPGRAGVGSGAFYTRRWPSPDETTDVVLLACGGKGRGHVGPPAVMDSATVVGAVTVDDIQRSMTSSGGSATARRTSPDK